MLTEQNGMGTTMLVSPAGNFGGGFGNGGFGGDWGWIILLLLLAGNGGWGMGGFGGGYGNAYEFPWLFNGQQGINNNVSSGFRDAQLQDSITSVRDGISSLSTQLCNCCGDIAQQLCSGLQELHHLLQEHRTQSLSNSTPISLQTCRGALMLKQQPLRA